MARFKRMQVLNTILDAGVVPIFYNPDVEMAKNVVQACVSGGAPVLEFTNRGDRAIHVFHELIEFLAKEAPDAILGVGSVIEPGTAAMYINEGANFVVSPSFNPETAKICNRRKIAYIPGCGSASEISLVEEYGSEIIKLFPANEMGGTAFVKAVLAPCPWHLLMPTGGVDASKENLEGWFKAGVACVGMGSNLLRKDLIAAGDYERVSKLVAQVIAWIREIRTEMA
jgi:2-dehydro-3-deoxyphosphogluconate aldolase/(4S)-4-hydroxy-2-oxoglutarate aldolase